MASGWGTGARASVTAQSGDAATVPAGGNCYACHQITKEDISFGNIGPSLYNCGKLRSNTEAIQRYTWARVWRSHVFKACSSMPRSRMPAS
jgi:sulfur-oxidizing protein SoxX